MSTLRQHKVESEIVLAHIRLASLGPVELRNTHPFRRELMGHVHTFAHNGHLPGVQDQLITDFDKSLVPVGSTDSGHVFCVLMQRMNAIWHNNDTLPNLAERIAFVSGFAKEISAFGPANFLYSDGEVLFVHGHKRKQANGITRSPGLHYISIECNYGFGQSELTSVEFSSEQVQQVTLVSTLPLREGGWLPMEEGQLLVVKNGSIIYDQKAIPVSDSMRIDDLLQAPPSPRCCSLQLNKPHYSTTSA